MDVMLVSRRACHSLKRLAVRRLSAMPRGCARLVAVMLTTKANHLAKLAGKLRWG
jgi:hypothetical protein